MQTFNKLIQQKFDWMQTKKLFRVALTGDQIWAIYLNSFSKEDDPVFRDPNSTSHNCNHCKNFIRRYGNVVGVDEDCDIHTMFDVEITGEYGNAVKQLTKAIKNSPIKEVFFETFNELNSLPYESCSKSSDKFKLGIDKNVKRYTKEEAEKYGVVKENEIRTFHHIHMSLNKEFVDMSGKSVEAIMGEFRQAKEVFQRGMETISLDTLSLVKDLINQGSLLDGATHLYKVEKMIFLKSQYDNVVHPSKRDIWCWTTSYKFPLAKFRNELIGVLCSELSEGKELNEAVQAWNKRVDPANYMKATAPITSRQIEEAKKFVEENGYTESFDRRMAVMEDIKVSEILHANAGDGKIKKVSIFDNVKTTSTRHKRSEFKGIEEVDIEKFMKDILPTCTSIEAFVGANHENNFVTLTTANNPESKPIMKWNNNFSWTYNGNLAGKSQIKEAVKTKGGKVDGILRFSMIWNYADGKDNSDLDAWCMQPNREHIGYSTSFRKDSYGVLSSCSGQLDLDNTNPGGRLAVENIYFADLKKMKDGDYKFWVNQFSARNSQGFKAEIEFEGQTYTYNYERPVSGNVNVATVTLKNGQFTIKHSLDASEDGVSKEIYGLQTNEFHKVNLVCLSPNHWGSNVGNKHYFFMLENCQSPIPIRSFHNENLIPELLEHRKVLEVLGSTNTCPSIPKQLSGIGFNATVKDELIVRLQGTHKRMLKIKF